MSILSIVSKVSTFFFPPPLHHIKLSIKKAHIALRQDGSTITRSHIVHSAWMAVPSHTASQSTPPGGQYHHTLPHRALCLDGSTITRSLTEHSAAWMAVPSHAASQSICCLDGSTMSNLVHRQRRCARIVPYTILCLEGSTPEEGMVYLVFVLWPTEGTEDRIMS